MRIIGKCVAIMSLFICLLSGFGCITEESASGIALWVFHTCGPDEDELCCGPSLEEICTPLEKEDQISTVTLTLDQNYLRESLHMTTPHPFDSGPAGPVQDVKVTISESSFFKAAARESQGSAFGPTIVFNGFKADSGQVFIDTDHNGGAEFVFPITGMGDQKACVDFLADGCDSADLSIERDMFDSRTFRITSPLDEGVGLPGVGVRVVFAQGVFEVPSGPGDLETVLVTFSRDDFTRANIISSFAPGLLGYMSTLVAGTIGDIEVESTVVVNNAGPAAVSGRMDFFNSEDGLRLVFKVNQQAESTSHSFEIPADSSSRFKLSTDQAGLVAGWGVITADGPSLAASTVFSTFQQGESAAPSEDPLGLEGRTLAGEAGVAVVQAAFHHVLDVEKTVGGFDTALAIVNPTEISAAIGLTLKDENQNTIKSVNQSLGPNQQTSRFFLELLRMEETESFSGTVVINTENAIAVTTLRTLNGFQVSSLQGGIF